MFNFRNGRMMNATVGTRALLNCAFVLLLASWLFFFLLRYGMLTHVVYDVFIMGDEDDENAQGLRGTSRFNNDMEAFTKEGLKFK